jgi:hypothetical protein
LTGIAAIILFAQAKRPEATHEWEQAVALRSKRVLLVDDNATNRRTLRLHTASWATPSGETGSPVETLA